MLNSDIRNLLGAFGMTWLWESTFPPIHIMKSTFRSIRAKENLVFALRCAVRIRHCLEVEDVVPKKKMCVVGTFSC